MEKIKKAASLFLGFPLTIISLLFILKLLYDFRDKIYDYLFHIDFLLFTFGVLLFSLFFFIKSFAWIEMLGRRGHAVSKRKTIYLYAISEIKRYLPVSFMSFVARVSSLSGSVSKTDSVKVIGIETVLIIISSAFISIPALLYSFSKLNNIYILFTFLLSIIILFVISFVFFKKHLGIITKYFDPFLILCLSWLIYGIASLFVLLSFDSINPSDTLIIMSFFVLSWLFGYLSFITPMGLGVRELAMTGSLSLFVPLVVASAISILSRVAMIFGEIFFVTVIFAFSRLKENSFLLKINPYKLILFICSFLYSCYFIYFTFLRHERFISGRFDLGNMSQTIWNTTRGNFLMLTNPDGVNNISRLGIHTDFILILFSPFYLIWSDPRLLLLIQTIVIACGAFFVFGISKLILKNEKISLIFSVSYLLNFWVQEQNIFDFHSVSLATTFLLATFYYLFKKNYVLFFAFLSLSLLTKENVFLISFLIGLHLFFIQHNKKIGAILSIFSILIFYYFMEFLIPNSRGTAHFASTYYSYLGDSVGDVLKNVITSPGILFGQVFRFETFDYFNKLLLPTGYLSLLSPFYLMFAAPDLLINTLSSNSNLRSEYYHYGANIVPFLYISSIFAVKFLKEKWGENILKIVFYYLIFTIIVTSYKYSPIIGMKNADISPFLVKNFENIKSYLSIISDNASVSASNSIGAHLSNRENIYVVPRGMDIADYVVFYREDPKFISQLNYSKYDLLVEYGELFIYKRKSTTYLERSL